MTEGAVIWEGPAALGSGRPIVAIVTGTDGTSTNDKTGKLSQVWILLRDTHPVAAVKSDLDEEICGTCRHRGTGAGRRRTCYVNLHWAAAGVWRAYQDGLYGRPDLGLASSLIGGGAGGHLGYTHAWRYCDPALRNLVMASCDTPEEAREARALGWRPFRVRLPSEPLLPGEIVCPASEEATAARAARFVAKSGVPPTRQLLKRSEAAVKVTCQDCMLCDGVRLGSEPRRSMPGARTDNLGVRLGAYGDPAAVPTEVWMQLLSARAGAGRGAAAAPRLDRRAPVTIIVHGNGAPMFVSQRQSLEHQLELAFAAPPASPEVKLQRRGLPVMT